MAINDLTQELSKDVRLDGSLEKRICDAVLDRLQRDTCNDVQALSVKCLSVLVTRIQETHVIDVATKLSEHILKGKAELRDIYSIGLKTLISDLPVSTGDRIATVISGGIVAGLSSPDAAIVSECLDITTELLNRFGAKMERDHTPLLKAVLKQLSCSQPLVRKRGAVCLGALAVHVSDRLLQGLVEELLRGIQAPAAGQDVHALIQSVGTVGRKVGFRLGRHLPAIVPLFLSFINQDMSAQEDAVANDLREICFQALESLVVRCPSEVSEFLPAILACVRTFCQYDPNYTYSEDVEDVEEEDYGYGDYEDGGMYSDDGDSSWKTRRSAIKVLSAIISSRPELLRSMYEDSPAGPSFAAHLVDRFKEREESVKVDVISCFTDLLRCTVVVEGPSKYTNGLHKSLNDSIGLGSGGAGASLPSALLPPAHTLSVADAVSAGLIKPPPLTRQRSCFDMLEGLSSSVVASSAKLLGSSESKVKIALWTMLRQLALVMGTRMHAFFPTLLPAAVASLRESNSALRLEGLLFVRVLLDTSKPEHFRPFMPLLVDAITKCTTDEWYRIQAEALRSTGRLAVVLRSSSEGSEAAVFDVTPFVPRLYESILAHLRVHDVDQEIKECAITSMGLLLAFVGDVLGPQLPAVLPLFLDRLRNEVTRAPVLKALGFIAESHLCLDLSPILRSVVLELGGFLRQQSRSLRQACLATLLSLVLYHGQHIAVEALRDVLREASCMVDEADLQLSHLALLLATAVIKKHPKAADLLGENVLPRALALSCSPLLQADALASLQHFFKELVSLGAPGLDYNTLMASLLALRHTHAHSHAASVSSPGDAPADMSTYGKQASFNVARIAGVLCVSAPAADQQVTVDRLLLQLRADAPETQLLALLTLGEIGWQADVPSSHPSALPSVAALLGVGPSAGVAGSASEDVRLAAAIALGGLCVGNMAVGLPALLAFLAAGSSTYLLFTSLKEVLGRHQPLTPTGRDFSGYVEAVLPILSAHCDAAEEGVRNMVAECLGKLCGVSPERVVPWLAALTSHESRLCRWTAVTSLKYAVACVSARRCLRSSLGVFLELLQDVCLGVRLAALVALNAVVHCEAVLVQAHVLPVAVGVEERLAEPVPPEGSVAVLGILPVLYYEMQPRESLARDVNLGPFTHKVDDGLPLRKAAFSCMDSVLEHMREKVGASFLPRLRGGLQDDNSDVQTLCHQLAVKVCGWPEWHGLVRADLDKIAIALEASFRPAAKADAGKGDGGRSDLLRSAVRTVDALSRIPDALASRSFASLLNRCVVEFGPTVESVRGERASAGAGAGAGVGSGAGGAAVTFGGAGGF